MLSLQKKNRTAMYVYLKQKLPYIILLIVSLVCPIIIWLGMKFI